MYFYYYYWWWTLCCSKALSRLQENWKWICLFLPPWFYLISKCFDLVLRGFGISYALFFCTFSNWKVERTCVGVGIFRMEKHISTKKLQAFFTRLMPCVYFGNFYNDFWTRALSLVFFIMNISYYVSCW